MQDSPDMDSNDAHKMQDIDAAHHCAGTASDAASDAAAAAAEQEQILPVPGLGDCGIWAVMVAWLCPVCDDDDAFHTRLQRLLAPPLPPLAAVSHPLPSYPPPVSFLEFMREYRDRAHLDPSPDLWLRRGPSPISRHHPAQPQAIYAEAVAYAGSVARHMRLLLSLYRRSRAEFHLQRQELEQDTPEERERVLSTMQKEGTYLSVQSIKVFASLLGADMIVRTVGAAESVEERADIHPVWLQAHAACNHPILPLRIRFAACRQRAGGEPNHFEGILLQTEPRSVAPATAALAAAAASSSLSVPPADKETQFLQRALPGQVWAHPPLARILARASQHVERTVSASGASARPYTMSFVLAGPPATGKTRLAAAIASQLNEGSAPGQFLCSFAAQSVAKTPGRTVERQLADAMREWLRLRPPGARPAIPVVLIDEADRANKQLMECFRTFLREGYLQLPGEPDRISLPSNWALLFLWVTNAGDVFLRTEPTDAKDHCERVRQVSAVLQQQLFYNDPSLTSRMIQNVDEEEGVLVLYALSGENKRAHAQAALAEAVCWFQHHWQVTLQMPFEAEFVLEGWDHTTGDLFARLQQRIRDALRHVPSSVRQVQVQFAGDRLTASALNSESEALSPVLRSSASPSSAHASSPPAPVGCTSASQGLPPLEAWRAFAHQDAQGQWWFPQSHTHLNHTLEQLGLVPPVPKNVFEQVRKSLARANKKTPMEKSAICLGLTAAQLKSKYRLGKNPTSTRWVPLDVFRKEIEKKQRGWSSSVAASSSEQRFTSAAAQPQALLQQGGAEAMVTAAPPLSPYVTDVDGDSIMATATGDGAGQSDSNVAALQDGSVPMSMSFPGCGSSFQPYSWMEQTQALGPTSGSDPFLSPPSSPAQRSPHVGFLEPPALGTPPAAPAASVGNSAFAVDLSPDRSFQQWVLSTPSRPLSLARSPSPIALPSPAAAQPMEPSRAALCLPTSVIQVIFAFLPLEAKCRASRVCRAWQAVVVVASEESRALKEIPHLITALNLDVTPWSTSSVVALQLPALTSLTCFAKPLVPSSLDCNWKFPASLRHLRLTLSAFVDDEDEAWALRGVGCLEQLRTLTLKKLCPSSNLRSLRYLRSLHTLALAMQDPGDHLFTHSQLKCCDSLPQLTSLSLNDGQVSPSELAALSQQRCAPRLQELDLTQTTLCNEHIGYLFHFPSLVALRLPLPMHAHLGDFSDALHRLPLLRSLVLQLPTTALLHLPNKLTALDLTCPSLPQAACRKLLAELPCLLDLSLTCPHFSSLEPLLAVASSLRRLTLKGGSVVDWRPDLPHLAAMKSLERVHVLECRASHDAVASLPQAELQQHLPPGCSITVTYAPPAPPHDGENSIDDTEESPLEEVEDVEEGTVVEGEWPFEEVEIEEVDPDDEVNFVEPLDVEEQDRLAVFV